jgi:hypothetical protein
MATLPVPMVVQPETKRTDDKVEEMLVQCHDQALDTDGERTLDTDDEAAIELTLQQYRRPCETNLDGRRQPNDKEANQENCQFLLALLLKKVGHAESTWAQLPTEEKDALHDLLLSEPETRDDPARKPLVRYLLLNRIARLTDSEADKRVMFGLLMVNYETGTPLDSEHTDRLLQELMRRYGINHTKLTVQEESTLHQLLLVRSNDGTPADGREDQVSLELLMERTRPKGTAFDIMIKDMLEDSDSDDDEQQAAATIPKEDTRPVDVGWNMTDSEMARLYDLLMGLRARRDGTMTARHKEALRQLLLARRKSKTDEPSLKRPAEEEDAPDGLKKQRKQVKCSKCGEVGHMKSNQSCPLYGH